MKLTKAFLQLEKEILSGKLLLPALPSIALKVKSAVKDPAVDLHKLGEVVKLDAPFCAFVINLANSPMYRGQDSIQSVSVALGRMGMQAAKNSAMIYAVRSLYATRDPIVKKFLKSVWLRATKVAALSFVISKRMQIGNPELASMAGLFHNVGLIPLLIYLVENGYNENEIKRYWGTINQYSRRLTVRVLTSWEIDKEMIQVAQNTYDWQPHQDAPLVDLVNLALWHSYLGTKAFKNLPLLDTLGFFSERPMLELENGCSLLFIKESNDEINHLIRSLNG